MGSSRIAWRSFAPALVLASLCAWLPAGRGADPEPDGGDFTITAERLVELVESVIRERDGESREASVLRVYDVRVILRPRRQFVAPRLGLADLDGDR